MKTNKSRIVEAQHEKRFIFFIDYISSFSLWMSLIIENVSMTEMGIAYCLEFAICLWGITNIHPIELQGTTTTLPLWDTQICKITFYFLKKYVAGFGNLLY